MQNLTIKLTNAHEAFKNLLFLRIVCATRAAGGDVGRLLYSCCMSVPDLRMFNNVGFRKALFSLLWWIFFIGCECGDYFSFSCEFMLFLTTLRRVCISLSLSRTSILVFCSIFLLSPSLSFISLIFGCLNLGCIPQPIYSRWMLSK